MVSCTNEVKVMREKCKLLYIRGAYVGILGIIRMREEMRFHPFFLSHKVSTRESNLLKLENSTSCSTFMPCDTPSVDKV